MSQAATSHSREVPNRTRQADTPRCETRIVSDVPAVEDRFGSHSRIAQAIAEILLDDEGGRSIGIAGRWGTGKSTVISLLRRLLQRESRVHIWVFDAWAHEGDPLRRTFLEDLIDELVRIEWLVDKKHWKKTQDRLSKRIRHQNTTSHPRVTAGGYLAGFGLLLVPFGTVLFSAGVTAGLTLVPTGDINVIAVWGAVFLSGPVLLPLIGWGSWNAWRKASGRADRTGPISLRDMFTPLARVQATEVVSETTEDPEPTSVEFSRIFRRVMEAALPDIHPERRLVLVLDNLDRVASAEQSQRVWATLQPFLQPASQTPSWQPRLWMLITYDPAGMERLGSDPGGDGWRQSYVDKTIRVEFQVPLPILSDWRSYLGEKLRDALPTHDQEDLDATIQLVALWYPSIALPPTPRELVQIVNGIGAYHRQWNHDVPLVHIAYHVLASRHNHELTEPGPTHLSRVVGRELEDDRYSLAFGVPRASARQLRVGDEALTALGRGDHVTIQTLLGNTKDLWQVMEVLLHRIGAEWVASQPAKILRALGVAVSYEESVPDIERLRDLLVGLALQVEEWEDLDVTTDRGVAGLIQYPESVRAYFAQRGHLMKKNVEQVQDRLTSEVASLEELIDTIRKSGLTDGIGIQVDDPAAYAALTAAASETAKRDRNHCVWKSLVYSGDGDAIITWLTGSERHPDQQYTLRALAQSGGEVPWAEVATALQGEISGASNKSTQIAIRLAAETVERPEIASIIRKMVKKGQWLDAMLSEQVRSDADAVAWGVCAAVVATDNNDVSWLNKLSVLERRAVGLRMWPVSRELSVELATWNALTLGDALNVLQGFVKGIAETGWEELDVGMVLRAHRALSGAGVLETVMSVAGKDILLADLKTVPFDLARSVVYGIAVRIIDNEEFDRWVSRQVLSADPSAWSRSISQAWSARDVGALVGELDARGAPVTLGMEVGKAIATNIPNTQPVMPELFRALDEAAADHVSAAVYAEVVSNRMLAKAQTFNDLGAPLSRAPQMGHLREPTVKAVILPIINNKTYPVAALEWLADTILRNPRLVADRGQQKRKMILKATRDRLTEPGLSDKRRTALTTITEVVLGTLE